MLYEIKHRFTHKVLFSLDTASLKLTVMGAVKVKADLSGTNLYGADLSGTDLSGTENIKIAWHVHHEKLWEVLTEPIENRIAYIKSDKPKDEQTTRLRLLKPIIGPLPEKMTCSPRERG